MTEVDDKLEDLDTTEPPGDELSFVTKKFAFQALLEKAATVVPSRDIQPVLRNFLIEAETGKVRVAATDLQLSIIATGQLIVVKKPGACVLPAAKMLSIVRETADGDMAVEVKNGEAAITIGPTTWTLPVADSGEYPPLPAESEIEFTAIDRGAFVAALNTVRYAVCKDSLKPGYMMIDVNAGRMRASDSIRFQQVPVDGVPDMQIPGGAVSHLIKTLRETEVPKIEVGSDEYQLVFRIGLDVFITQRLSAVFPDVDGSLLKPVMGNDQELQCDRAELVAAIRRVRITADDDTGAIGLEISKDGLRVAAADKYGSWSATSVDADWDHDDRKAGFNQQYLLEMLQQSDAKTVSLKFGKDEPQRPSPVLIEDATTGAQGVLHQLHLVGL